MVQKIHKFLKANQRYCVRVAVVLFWVLAMLALMRYEAFPEYFTNTLRGYRSVLPETVLIQDSWSRIIINETPAGYSHTSMNVDDQGEAQNIEIRNRTNIRIAIMGQPLNLNIRTTLLLDPQYELLQFNSSVYTQEINLNVNGQRTESDIFDVTTELGGVKTSKRIKIPKDALLYSPMNALAMRKLRPGQSLAIKTLDPLSMRSSRIIVKAIKKEVIQHNHKPVEAVLLTTNYQGMQLLSWIDKHGVVLKQETPMGWIIEECSSEDAIASISSEHTPPDFTSNKTSTLLMKLISATAFGKEGL